MVVCWMLVATSVATTVTSGTTAPVGSVTTPEMEPVMLADAVIAARTNKIPRMMEKNRLKSLMDRGLALMLKSEIRRERALVVKLLKKIGLHHPGPITVN